MAHTASIVTGIESHNYGISETESHPRTQLSAERNRSYNASGDPARSNHGPARTTTVAEDSPSVLDLQGHPKSIPPPVVLGETGSIYRLEEDSGSLLSEQVVHAYVLDLQSRGRRPMTIRGYLHALSYWPVMWPKTVDDMLPSLDKMRHLSPRTRHDTLVNWGTFGKFAEEKFGLENVVPDLPHVPVPRTLRNVPGEHEIQALMAVCNDNRDRAMILLLAGTGIRWGEMPMLRSQIRGDQFYTAEGKTGERLVPLPEPVAESLSLIGDQESLWLNERSGRPMLLSGLHIRFRRTRDRLRKRVIEAVRDNDGSLYKTIDPSIHITPHLLRHFFAVQFLESGGDIRALQEILGHRDISTTAIYLTITVGHLKKSMNRHSPASRLIGNGGTSHRLPGISYGEKTA